VSRQRRVGHDHEARGDRHDELRRDGHEVVEFGDGATLLAQLRFDIVTRGLAEERCLVIAGQRTSVFTGLEVLTRLRTNAWDTPCVIVNAGDDPRLHAAARQLGATAVLDTFDVEQLRGTARRIAARRPAD